MISDYGTDCVGKCEGFREEQPERKSPEGTGVDYARKIYRDESGRCGGVRSGESCQVDRDGVVSK